MKSVTLPIQYENKILNQQLKKYKLLELLKRDLNTLDILLLNEILEEYHNLKIVKFRGENYRYYTYENVNKKYAKVINVSGYWTKSKAKLEAVGLIKTTRIGGKLAIRLINSEVNKILW